MLLAALSLRAQSPGQAKNAKIAAIAVTGTRKFPPAQIISASGLKIGDVVTAEQIQAVADRLSAVGLFSSVSYRFTSKGDSISLEFQVQEAPTVPLWFDNFPWFTDEELAARIRQEVGLFAGEAPESGIMLDEITDALGKLLSSHNIAGNITHQVVAPPVGDGMIMQFRFEGSDLKVRSVQFGDSLAVNSERLKDRISDIRGQSYSRFAIAIFENEQVRPLYAAKGFLGAQIGPPQSHLDGNAVDISIPITPGAVYSWKGVSWQGNIAASSASLDAASPMKSGDVADGMKIEDMWRRIEFDYGKRGYLDAKVDAQPQFDDAAYQVSYRASIAEGAQYRMGEMVITGLSLDAEKVLRRAWQIAPGQIFDNGYFEKLVKVLIKPSPEIFGEMPVHYTECGHWLRPNADRHTVDVLLDFK
jgi:outer membrane protein assembly factor BamA